MSFMEEILDRNIPIWDRCIATPFVQGIKSGNLDLESFKTYMIQDSIYLKHYARIYGKAIYHAVRHNGCGYQVRPPIAGDSQLYRLFVSGGRAGRQPRDFDGSAPLYAELQLHLSLDRGAAGKPEVEILGFHTGLRGQPVCPGLSEYVRLRGTKMHGALRPKVRRATPRL